jgi:putative ABC transport system permease protein
MEEGAADLSYWSLAVFYGLFLIPILVCWYFRIRIIKEMLIGIGRMTAQLFLIGIFLLYLFEWNNSWINIAWVTGMIFFATLATINTSELNYTHFLLPVFSAFLISTFLILFLFNGFLVELNRIFDARYLIVIGGMLLGNSLKGDIIGISHFYQAIRRDEKRYFYLLSMGANQLEALTPFFRESMIAALKPFIASMATIGLVSLPGMMTGQIIQGASPFEAVNYQIAIMIAIFTSTTLTICLTILFSVKKSFDDYGILKKEVFKKRPS